MYLVDIFLPLAGNNGERFSNDLFDHVRSELTEQFGGVTAYLRAPAVGLWQDSEGKIRRDDIAVFEVMTKMLDREWWRDYRQQLEKRFQQQEIVARAIAAESL